MSNYIEKAASPQILNYAWQFLPHDRGNWVCGLSVEEIRPNLIRHVGELSEQLLRGNYKPEPMCYRYSNRERSVIGVSTVRDQLVQFAILSVLEPLAKAKINFGRMTKETAIAQVRDLVGDGYVWVKTGQIEDCLDNIPIPVNEIF